MDMYRQWILKSRPDGPFATSDFELREVPWPQLGDNELLVRTLYLSFDPTQRGWAVRDTYVPAVELGQPMRATGIGQVVESTSKKFAVGDLVAGLVDWQEYAHVDLKREQLTEWIKIPGFMDPELTLAFMPTGLTAYFGLLDLGKPKAGEVVVVSGAAGATGSIAAQIAKLEGARAVGIAGGPDKCRFLLEELGLDGAIDYKNEDVGRRLDELCPDGVDVFFDNVGGAILDAVLIRLARGARVVVCGAISQYEKIGSDDGSGPHVLDGVKGAPNIVDDESGLDALYGVKATPNLIVARATMQGFVVLDFMDRALEGLFRLHRWHQSGRLVQAIDRQEGFENIPSTMIRLFEGKNVGKQILRVAEPPLPVKRSAPARLGFEVVSRLIDWRKGLLRGRRRREVR